MECPKCHHQNPEDSKFCNKCSYQFLETDDIRESPDSMASERKHVTIMFSDMSGYTAMTECLDPEEVKRIMSDIFGKITDIIKSYDGFIERFVGDAVMAVFGVPQAHEDDPIRAIRAAIEIHAAVENLSPQYEKIIGCSLNMHTGINTGLVVTGEVNLEKGSHGLTGDAINLASRLESIAKAGEIVVGPETHNQALNLFDFKILEPTKVRGKKQPVNIYKVQSVKKESFKIHRLQGLQASLTGRNEEMTILVEAAERLKQGQGSIVSIWGDAGTGKSRLKKEFKDNLDLEKILWLEGHAYSYTQNMPYYPLINLLTHAFRIDEGDTPERIREKVETGVNYLLGQGNKHTPYIGSLFALTYHDIEDVSPEFWKDKLRESIQMILSALFERGPTIFCFEDLHWADPSFIELLKQLAVSSTRKALLINTYRLHFSFFDGDLPDNIKSRYHEIRLKELETQDAQKMLVSLLGTKNIPVGLNEFVQQKTEGNPFYLEEMVNSLIESEILTRDNGSWKLSHTITEADIPANIHGLLTARVDRLGKDLKRILQEASVIGRAFLYKILEKITDIDSDLDQHLSSLTKLDLIRTQSMEPELEYIFKHALTQEVVYDGLLKSQRKIIHERIGFVIEKLFQNRLPKFYETLAYHFRQSQLGHKAVEYLMKSGEKSLKRYAVEESHRYYKEAYNILSNKSIESEEEKTLIIHLLIKWSLVYYFRGDYRGLLDILSAHKEIAESLKDQSAAGLFYAWLGHTLYARQSNKEAYEYLLKGLKIGEEFEDNKIVGYASAWLTYLCGDLGLFDESLRFSERALKIADTEKSDSYLFFKPLGGVAQTCYYLGNAKKAYEAGSVCQRFGKKQANVRGMVMGHIGLGISYANVGKFDSCIRELKRAVEVSADPFYRQVANYALGSAYVLSEQFDEASQVLQEVRSYGNEYGCEWASIPANMFLGVIQIGTGKMTRGLRMVKESLEKFIEAGRKPYIAITEYVLGKIFYMMVNPKDPISIFMIIKNIVFLIKNRPLARRRAEAHFARAIAVAKEINANGILGQAYLDMGFLKSTMNSIEEAKIYLSAAIQIFEECEAEVYIKQAKDALENLGK